MKKSHYRHGSYQYQESKEDLTKHTIDEIAEIFGVSRNFVKQHIWGGEWHHCNFKYGSGAKAYFVTDKDIERFKENIKIFPSLQKKFEKSKAKGLARQKKGGTVHIPIRYGLQIKEIPREVKERFENNRMIRFINVIIRGPHKGKRYIEFHRTPDKKIIYKESKWLPNRTTLDLSEKDFYQWVKIQKKKP